MNRDVGERPVLLSSCYLAPAEYYALFFRREEVVIEVCDNYQKRSYRNRCHIAGANGMLTLTVPVEKPTRENATMRDVRIADHGNWQSLHWNAITSAYRSTPFFLFYEDAFRPFYEKKQRYLHDFNEELRMLICRLIGIETAITTSSTFVANPAEMDDYREVIHPKRSSPFRIPPYYQVFADKNGFMPHLSIIDLLFNMGNEARLVLRQIETG